MPNYYHPKPTTGDMTTSDVAAEFGCSPRTIHRKVKSGDLRYKLKFPGQTGGYLFRRADVERAFRKDVSA